MSAHANARAVAAHDALLIPTSYVDDLESFIFVLADFCMRNSNTFRRLSEFAAVPKWIVDPVSHAALIEKRKDPRPWHLCMGARTTRATCLLKTL